MVSVFLRREGIEKVLFVVVLVSFFALSFAATSQVTTEFNVVPSTGKVSDNTFLGNSFGGYSDYLIILVLLIIIYTIFRNRKFKNYSKKKSTKKKISKKSTKKKK